MAEDETDFGIPLSEIGPSPFDVSEPAEPEQDFSKPVQMKLVTPDVEQESREYLADKQARSQPDTGSFEADVDRWTLNEIAPPRATPNLPDYPYTTFEPPPTEEEAKAAQESIVPGISSLEDIEKAEEISNRYYASQDEETRRKEEENINAQYRDDKALLALSKDPRMRAAIDMSLDVKESTVKTAVNENFLEHWRGRPLTDVELEESRNAYALEHWGISRISHDSFYGRRREEVLLQDKIRSAQIDAIGMSVIQGAQDELAGQPTQMSKVFEQVKTKYPELTDTPEKQAALMASLRMTQGEIRKIADRYRPQMAVAFPIFQKMMTGEATNEDTVRLYDTLSGMSDKDIGTIIDLGATALHAYDKEIDTSTVGQKIMVELDNAKKAIFSGFGFIPQGSLTLQEYQLLGNKTSIEEGRGYMTPRGPVYLPPGQIVQAGDPNFRPMTEEEKVYHAGLFDRGIGILRLQRTLNSAVTQKFDPFHYIFERGTWMGSFERGGLALTQSLPAMGTAALAGIVGTYAGGPTTGAMASNAVLYWTTFEQEKNDLLVSNPTLSIESADTMAMYSSLAQLPLNHIQLETALGKGGLFTILRQIKNGRVATALSKMAIAGGTEFGTEMAQNYISGLTQEIAAQAKLDLPKAMGKAWDDTLEQGWETFFATLPLTLLGTGLSEIRDYRNPGEVFTEEALRQAGLNPEAIARVQTQTTWQGMRDQLMKEFPKRDPVDIAAGGREAVETQTQANQAVADMMNDLTMPRIEKIRADDGSTQYKVIDADGKVVTTASSQDAADDVYLEQAELVRHKQQLAEAEEIAARAAEAETDEGVAREAEARATAETVSPEDRLGTALVLDFEENVTPTPAEQQQLAGLQADIAAAGRGDQIVLARVSDTQTGPGKATLDFVRAFERATGKQVVFVASGNDQPLSFTGAVRKGDPNTIFLDAHGDRNVLALVGHEWSHTLEKSNPTLHAEMVGRMKPLVVDWAKQEGILAKEVGPENVTNEMVANIVGDAIANENFWTVLAQKNPSLFEKVRDAVIQFFNQFLNKVQKSEFGTEAFADAQKMRDIVAEMMDRASRGGPEAAVGAGAGVAFAPRRIEPPSPGKQAPSLAKRGAPVAVTVYDRSANGFVQKPMKPTVALLRDLQRERNIYEKLLQCL